MTRLPTSIRRRTCCTDHQLRYWRRKAAELTGRVDIVDPHRAYMRDLRDEYPAGTRVYRASTGGKWGRSAEIVTL